MKPNPKSGCTMKIMAFSLIAFSLLFSSEGLSQEHVVVDTAAARAFFEQGLQLQKVARYDSAIVLFDKAIGIFARTHRLGSQVLCLNAKAQCLQEKGSYDKALDALRIGIEAGQDLLKETPVIAAQRLLLMLS